jgi:hypothetical protein
MCISYFWIWSWLILNQSDNIQKTEQSSYPISNRISRESDISQLQFFSYPLKPALSNPIRNYPILSWKTVDPILWVNRSDPTLSEKTKPVRRIYFDLILWVNHLSLIQCPKETESPKKRSKSCRNLIKPREANLILKSNSGKNIQKSKIHGETAVTVSIPLIQDQLFICALLLNFSNNLAGGTHVKAQTPKRRA